MKVPNTIFGFKMLIQCLVTIIDCSDIMNFSTVKYVLMDLKKLLL
jgi:hypothetical protein